MTDKYQVLREALALGPTEGYEYDSNQTPFYDDADGFSRGGDDDGTYTVFAPSFTAPGDDYEYDGPVLSERTSEGDAKFICAANPATIQALLAERDAMRAVAERASEALENYERHGEICPFEGHSMIYAETLVEIGDLARAALTK